MTGSSAIERDTTRAESAVLAPLGRARRTLRNVELGRAILIGIAVAALVFIVTELSTLLMGRVSATAESPSGLMAMLTALLLGIAATVFLLWRTIRRVTTESVALWVEEKHPLDYALVTAADPRTGAADRMAPRLASIPWNDLLRQAARRRLVRPAALAGAALVAAVLTPLVAGSFGGSAALSASGASSAAVPSRPTTGPLAGIRAEVQPPAYSGIRASALDDPASIPALVGSRITLGGRIAGDLPVEASVAGREAAVAVDGAAWRTSFSMPSEPALVRLGAGDAERMVLLEPRPDSIPVVVLSAAVTDTVLREPEGIIRLEAEARDDFGLESGGWEWIVTSGGGEQFRARNGTLGNTPLRGARTATLSATLDLTSLSVVPGDVVHVRASARDRNNVTGPGIGASETRTIRIARPDEYDSLTIEGAAPPPTDSALLSQRMLLMRTERLVARMASMPRQEVVDSSRSLAVDQATLRRRVGRLVYQKLGEDEDAEHSHFPGDGHDHGEETKIDPQDILARADAATGSGMPGALDFEGDETPVVAINRPLLEAYNHMWDAGRALEIADPSASIPPMRLALEAIQRAREAERYYLRGRPPRVVVDIAAARLEGKTTGSGSTREPLSAADPAAAMRLSRIEAAAVLAARDRDAAADSLIVLRVEVNGYPELAAALEESARLLRSGEDASAALARARRLAAPGSVRRSGTPAWRGW